jgi:3-mercaptopyruvate sulfurtransferase SseA
MKGRGTLAPQKRGHPVQGPVDYKERYDILKKYQTFLKEIEEKNSVYNERTATSSSSVGAVCGTGDCAINISYISAFIGS